jgi:hypothetical protein
VSSGADAVRRKRHLLYTEQPSRLDCYQTMPPAGDLFDALARLNSHVPHRFTEVYRLSSELLRCRAIFDKLGEVTPAILIAIPLRHNLRQFAVRSGCFESDDPPRDHRLNALAYQRVMVSHTAVANKATKAATKSSAHCAT